MNLANGYIRWPESHAMVQLLGRDAEQKALGESAGKGKAVLVYGRRGIGKTALLKSFCKGRRTLYLDCIPSKKATCHHELLRRIGEFCGAEPPNLIKGLEAACTEETVIVIDGFHNLMRADPSVVSRIHMFIDTFLQDTSSTLILSGSDVFAMRSLAEDGEGPLYGRFGRIIPLEPLPFSECRAFHPGMPPYDQLMLYLTVGGVPLHHIRCDRMSYRDAVIGMLESPCLADDAILLLEGSQDRSDILSAIADGCRSLKQISDRTGLGTRCVGILEKLVADGIVMKDNPMIGAPKRPVYRIRDGPLSFYYGVVRKAPIIPDSEGSYLRMQDLIRGHLESRFVLFCMDLIGRSYNVGSIGRWWMDNPKEDIHEDIDIVARIGIGTIRYDLFVECKLTAKPVGFHQYNDLARRASRFSDRSNPLLIIISEGGFEEDFEEFASAEGILLAGSEEIRGNRPMPRP